MELFNEILASLQNGDSELVVIALLVFIVITAVSLIVWLFKAMRDDRKENRKERMALVAQLESLSRSVNPEIPENSATNDIHIYEVLAKLANETGADVATLSERHNGSKSFGGGHLHFVSNTHSYPQSHIREIDKVPASVFAPGFKSLEEKGFFCSKNVSVESVSGASNLLMDLGIISVCAVIIPSDGAPNQFLSLHWRKVEQTTRSMKASINKAKLAAAQIRGILEL